MKVAVIGAGTWGTTLGAIVAQNADVVLWAREPEITEGVNERRENPLFLAGHRLPDRLCATADIEEAVTGADAVISAVPAQYVRAVLAGAEPHLDPAVPVLSLTKGIEQGTWRRPTEVLGEVLPRHEPSRIGVLAGPNIAREIAAGLPAATVVAMADEHAAAMVQRVVMTPRFRVYTNPDVLGCELGGAVKNVLAIAAGAADGLGLGDNAKAGLITRGLVELTRLGVALGGNPLTFIGLAGNGDLIVTCSSPLSRNYHVGHELGRGRSLDDVLAGMHMVAEGVKTAPGVLHLARRAGVSMPICEQVAGALAGDSSAEQALDALMLRDPVPELHGIG